MEEAGYGQVAYHVHACRSRFAGQCDVFIHTWDVLDKGKGYVETPDGQRCTKLCRKTIAQSKMSSWPCVHNLSASFNATAVWVERQPPPPQRTSIFANQSMANFRMNAASMANGVDLMMRHASLTGQTASQLYSAAVRIRADVGSRKMRGRPDFRSQFLDDVGWAHVRRRAGLALAGELSSHEVMEIVTCHRPYEKRIDFCFWSAPVTALQQSLAALRSDVIDRLISGDRRGECQEHLRSNRLPPMTENVLFCAMSSHGVRQSPLWDSWALGGPACTARGCRGLRRCTPLETARCARSNVTDLVGHS